MKELTEKQKAFARGMFEGLSQREAYKRAYDCAKKKDETVDALASRLLSNVKVKEYLEELNKEAESPLVLTKQERMEWLSRVVRTPLREVDDQSDLCQELTETSGPNGCSTKIFQARRHCRTQQDDRGLCAGENGNQGRALFQLASQGASCCSFGSAPGGVIASASFSSAARRCSSSGRM